MKLTVFILSLLFTLNFYSQNLQSNTNSQEQPEINEQKPKIAILGTFHFGNTSDYSAIVMEDLDSDRRQNEIAEFVDILANFKPTKILVEREPDFNDTLGERLEKYYAGEYTLPDNEIYQLGFPLAKNLGHEKIYGVDYQMGLGDQDLVTYLNENALMPEFGKIISKAQIWTKELTEFLKSHSLGELLVRLNSEESDRFNRNLYLDQILNIAPEGNSPASDYVSNWYKRNIFIKKNIDDLVEENDRILVILGAGHAAILKEFYRSSNEVEYISLENFYPHNFN